jgi:hypothetical protein
VFTAAALRVFGDSDVKRTVGAPQDVTVMHNSREARDDAPRQARGTKS